MNPDSNINMTGGVSSQNLDSNASSKLGVNSNKVNAIRSFSRKIISSRQQLEEYLLTKNLKLVTSFSDFVANQSFIKSSYIIYLEYNEQMELFSNFLLRNPAYQDIADKIEAESKK
jgi:hypothetical protein